MRVITLLPLLVIILLALPATSAALDVSGGSCEGKLYHDECMQGDGCVWCCSFPFGSQCLTQFRSWNCPSNARISSPSETCDDLCHHSVDGCSGCVMRHWCVFCASQLTCQSPLEACKNEEVLQTCETRDEIRETTRLVEKTLCFIGLGMFVAAFLLLCGLSAWNGFTAWRELRRERAEARAREETRPLLQSADPNGDGEEGDRAPGAPSGDASTNEEDESLCFMCLSARPTVTFLPCHHTCSCEACSNKLRPSKGTLTCPMCRAKIVSMISLSTVLRSSEARNN